jgi:hypothetical protein
VCPLHLTIITRTICSHPHSPDRLHHEHIAIETSMTWDMKWQKMPDHRPIEEIPVAKSIINMKRPTDSLANLSLFGDRGSPPSELVITNRYLYTTHSSSITTTKRHHNHMILVPDHYITLVRPDLFSVIALYDSSIRPTSLLVSSSSHASPLYYMITHASHFVFASSSALRMAIAISAANAFSFFSSSSTPVHPVTPVNIPVSLAV